MRWPQSLIVFAAIAISLLLAACGEKDNPDEAIFTLYSSAPSDQFFRGHEATFDAYLKSEDAFWNAKKCERVARLLQENWQAEVSKTISVRFWCEKGRYRK
ncbi:MAG: hypothetical protein IH606_23480 [Burkholderiales bacterium]|nr:hypothetical protein [Burkholderiales bacterium]